MEKDHKLAEPLLSAQDEPSTAADQASNDGLGSIKNTGKDDLATASHTDLEAGEDIVKHYLNISDCPQTRSRQIITATENPSGPAKLCCLFSFYHTHTTLVTGDAQHGEDQRYEWNARAHRKMRFPVLHGSAEGQRHPRNLCQRIRLVSWEPRNVTWHICWIGVVANTLWVVNGVYAVWPELARSEMGAINIPYYTGVIGAFLFIVTGYLGYVEAINHTYDEVRLPEASAKDSIAVEVSAKTKDESAKHNKRILWRIYTEYGRRMHPLGFTLDGDDDSIRSRRVMQKGYPLVLDSITGQLVTSRLYDRILEKYHGNSLAMGKAIEGRQLTLRIGKHDIFVRVEGEREDDSSDSDERRGDEFRADKSNYVWWTSKPDLHYIGIFSALAFFISTIIFWIPALAWWPMETNGASLPSTIFVVYVLQIVPSIGFVFVGHAAMAEASGSWFKPDFDAIGWWISFLNAVGGYGFLLYPILSLPSVVGDPGCCDDLMKWGAAMATLWGSCAFWLAGILQCIEFSSEHPITLEMGQKGGAKKET